MLEALALKTLHKIDPERAHDLSLKALRLGLVGGKGPWINPRLQTSIFGLHLPNPLGLAAGYDKNAVAIHPLAQTSFGFLEVGAVTPKPQPGNPKPRLFRLSADEAVINRFGFNNDGMYSAAERLAKRPEGATIGINLGANKDSDDRAADYTTVLKCCGPFVDFATVNVSSPNTAQLRDLQHSDALAPLLSAVMDTNAGLAKPLPILLKIAPDLDDAGIAEIAKCAENTGISGIIATNTTLSRDGLKSANAGETGGLSGKPLFTRSTYVLARLASETTLPLVGVGGISSAEDAYAKIKAGASALQIYSAFVYHGLSLIDKILSDLDDLLNRDGFASVADAVGTDRARLS